MTINQSHKALNTMTEMTNARAFGNHFTEDAADMIKT